MKTITCPDCGKQWVSVAPGLCDRCGCPSNKFIESEYNNNEYNSANSTSAQRTTVVQFSNIDEQSARIGAGFLFFLYVILGVIFIILGIVAISNGPRIDGRNMMAATGTGYIISGVLIIFMGWVMRCFIRLFANMSERLSSIDSKIK